MNVIILFGAEYLYLAAVFVATGYTFVQSRENRRQIFIFACIVLPIVYLVSRVAAFIYYDPRPFVVGHFTPLVPHAPDNGFPSDHALLTAALAAIITRYNWKMGAIVWLIAILVDTARVAAGIHHTIDIAGSVIISITGTLAVYLFLKNVAYKKVL